MPHNPPEEAAASPLLYTHKGWHVPHLPLPLFLTLAQHLSLSSLGHFPSACNMPAQLYSMPEPVPQWHHQPSNQAFNLLSVPALALAFFSMTGKLTSLMSSPKSPLFLLFLCSSPLCALHPVQDHYPLAPSAWPPRPLTSLGCESGCPQPAISATYSPSSTFPGLTATWRDF